MRHAHALRARLDAGATAGILGFVIVTVGLAWLPSTLLRCIFDSEPDSLPRQMLLASAGYVLTMTLPPVVALFVVRRWIDRAPLDYGAAPPSTRYRILAVAGAFAVMAAAAGIAQLVAPGAGPDRSVGPSRDLLLPLLFVVVIAFLLLQAAAEEIGWRGYLMPRMMERLGAWPGVVVHGALWGVWYAPLFAAANGVDDPGARSLQFVLTSTLLGVLLGWLRIASGSILTCVTANIVLTLAAGLPLVVMEDPPVRSAVYGPLGWIPLSVAILIVFATGRHAAVRGFARRR